MKNILILLAFLSCLYGHPLYFTEICSKSELRGEQEISRYTGDVKYYIKGDPSPKLEAFIDKTFTNINNIINKVRVYRVDAEWQANFKVYYCSEDEFVNIYPEYEDDIRDSYGLCLADDLFTNGRIKWTVAWISSDGPRQYHTALEEITQGFGMWNDSWRFKDSIFYQGNSNVTEWSKEDIMVIKYLYNTY